MNPSYVQTFNRHRILFSLPIALATLFALWFVAGAPKAYKSSTSLWVDTPPPAASSLDQTDASLVTPAAQAQQFLGELLTTRRFRLAVGHAGPLAKYLSTHSSGGWGPSALLAKLRGSGSVDDRVVAALDPGHLQATVAGPQVLGITLKGPSPVATVGTLRALVGAFNGERKNLDVTRRQGAVAYYQGQLSAAQSKGASPARIAAATKALHRATVSLAAARAEKGVFQVIDAAKLPAPPVSGMKNLVFALIGGLFAGALVSLLGI